MYLHHLDIKASACFGQGDCPLPVAEQGQAILAQWSKSSSIHRMRRTIREPQAGGEAEDAAGSNPVTPTILALKSDFQSLLFVFSDANFEG